MITVKKENNLLIIDDGVNPIEYLNAAWCSISFGGAEVIITEEGSQQFPVRHRILFTLFQGGESSPFTTAYATEAAIATYLSNKIG